MPVYQRSPNKPKNEKLALYGSKFASIIQKGYTELDPITSVVDYFDVSKGDDIRLVFNGTSCGLNDSLWAPSFWLPTPKTAIRSLDFDYFSVDLDLGEMLLNFPLHTELRPFSGMDLTPLKGELGEASRETFRVLWTRCWFGAKPSPYLAVRYYYYAEEFIRGNRQEKFNPLRLDRIILNLPGDPTFNPSKPRVMKWDDESKAISGDLHVIVDDLRASGPSAEDACQVVRTTASRIQHLGGHDAPRKRRPPTKNPGAWDGAIFQTGNNFVSKSVTQKNWNKGKGIIQSLVNSFKSGDEPTYFNYKDLEKAR